MREYGYGLSAEGLPLLEIPEVNWRALSSVIEWSLQQSDDIRLAVVEYLETPDIPQLNQVLLLIQGSEIIIEEKRRRPSSLSDLIVSLLPASIEDLYEAARRNHHSRRPEAAVRQTLRNLRKRGNLVEEEGGLLRWADG